MTPPESPFDKLRTGLFKGELGRVEDGIKLGIK